jgi:phage-related protein
MVKQMRAVYYRDRDGVEPVSDFIDHLGPGIQSEIDWHISLLNRLYENDPPLAFPYSSQIEGELRELRSKYGRRLYRILYRRSRNLFVLLHIFEKFTGSVPDAEKRIAMDRWKDFRARMRVNPHVPPRPGGRDAP